MADAKFGYDDSIIEESALGLDFKNDDSADMDTLLDSDLEDKDPEDDPSWSFTPSGAAGDKFEAEMDSSWVTMRMISHFISVTQPDLEEFLLIQMDQYFAAHDSSGTRQDRGESKGGDYSAQQYQIYQKYCDIFENSMEDFTDDHSKAEIVKTLRESNYSAESGRETMGTILLDMLEALSDFEEFHVMFEEKRRELALEGGSSSLPQQSKK